MSPVSEAIRLPTRCPACRGAVIQRIARAHGSVWFHCFFCKHSWRFRLEDARAVPDGEITGDVFVVTPSRERHALYRVVLQAIPEDLLRQHVERKTGECKRERKRVQREIDALAATLEEVRTEEDRLWKIQDRDKDNMRKAKAWSAAFNRLKNIIRQHDELLARRGQLISGEPFFQNLPAAISSAKTDADGKFTLAIPREGRYGIVARASCDLGQGTRRYCWFVWVSLDGMSAKRLVLNDDNVVGAGSADSVLQ